MCITYLTEDTKFVSKLYYSFKINEPFYQLYFILEILLLERNFSFCPNTNVLYIRQYQFKIIKFLIWRKSNVRVRAEAERSHHCTTYHWLPLKQPQFQLANLLVPHTQIILPSIAKIFLMACHQLKFTNPRTKTITTSSHITTGQASLLIIFKWTWWYTYQSKSMNSKCGIEIKILNTRLYNR